MGVERGQKCPARNAAKLMIVPEAMPNFFSGRQETECYYSMGSRTQCVDSVLVIGSIKHICLITLTISEIGSISFTTKGLSRSAPNDCAATQHRQNLCARSAQGSGLHISLKEWIKFHEEH